MSRLVFDLKMALRSLRRRPSFCLMVILILALGIGANSAIFSIISGLLLRPFPYPGSERLVQVWNKYPLMNLPRASVSIPDYLDRRRDVQVFEESCLFTFRNFNLAEEGEPERLVGVLATASLFSLTQIDPVIGRVFNEAEVQPGQTDIVVISQGLWERRFGKAPGIVGQQIRLNGVPHQVVGVMPDGFDFPHPRVQLWKPFAFTPQQMSDNSRGNEFSQMVARLAPGATLDQAQEQIDRIQAANLECVPQRRAFWESSGFGGLVISYRDQLFGPLKPTLLLLQAMVAFVLLVACANVANLFLTQVARRQKEVAIRSALGANHWRLARQLLTESLMLALAGGAAGLLVGMLGIRLVGWLGLTAATRGISIGIDGPVLFFTFLLSVLTGIIFGLFPIHSLWKTNASEVVNEGGRGNSGGQRQSWQRAFLVVTEVALAVVLLAGAGLLTRSLIRLQEEKPGFNPDNLSLAQVNLPSSRYSGNEQIIQFYDQALSRLRALPGVKSAGVISATPFSGSMSSGSYTIEGYTPGDGESAPHAMIRTVDPEYFKTLEIPLQAGRIFDSRDRADTPPSVLVDDVLVKKYWPGEDPLGQRLRRGGPNSPWFNVLGVVGHVKIAGLDQEVTKETIYASYTQLPNPGMTFTLRTEGDPSGVVNSLRQTIHELDPNLPLYNIVTMQQQVQGTLRTRQVSMTLLVIFAGVAVLLSCVGIYAVLAFSVNQRTREMGTRVALGAENRHIFSMILGQGMILTAIGLGVGLGASLVVGRWLSTLLFAIPSWDPLTLGGVSLVLGSVALIASMIPARRATRVDPTEALRSE